MQCLSSRSFRFLLILSFCVLLLPVSVLIIPDHAQAFGGLTENGTAAFMGIGINPTKILHVSGSGPGSVPLFSRGSDSAGFIIERTSTNRWVLGVNESPTLGTGFVLSTIPTGTQSVPRLLVTQDGRVGIGTVSPYTGARLHVINDNATSGARAILGVSNAANTNGVFGESDNGNGVYGKRGSSGNYGYLGGLRGAYGEDKSSGNFGYLGGNNNGVYGQSDDNSAVHGDSARGKGVYGNSENGTGAWGNSINGHGMHGVSETSYGVYGESTVHYGLYGVGGNGGVYGESENGTGISGHSTHGTGLAGSSDNSYGIWGQSESGIGIRGQSTSNRGVYGWCDSGAGVEGHSTSNMGMYGQSTTYRGVYGLNSTSNNYGFLGDNTTGVYGYSLNGFAGRFQGKAVVTDNLSVGTTTAANSTLEVHGSFATAFKPVTDNYTATAADSVIAANASAPVVAVTLPSASGITGREYTVKRIDNSENAAFVRCTGAETIDWLSTYDLSSRGKYVTVVSDGTNWLVVANN